MQTRIPRPPCLAALLRLGLALSLLLASLTGVFLGPAQAASLTVTSSANSGAGSLRQAVADAAPGDTIAFDASLAGQTITLASVLYLAKNVTIDGSALATPVTISGNNAVQVFSVSSGAIANLNGLKITGGAASHGGAISNGGTLTITDCTVSANRGTWGGAIINSGTLTIAGSTFSANHASWGSAILNDVEGTLTVTHSTFSDHTGASAISTDGIMTVAHSTFRANGGGAIDSMGMTTVENSVFSANIGYGAIDNSSSPMGLGNLIVTNSTFTGNQGSHGGAIANTGPAGLQATLVVTNSTFSANSGSFGGAIYSTGALTLANSTLSGNSTDFIGGGLFISGGTLSYTNTIVANSTGVDCYLDSEDASIITNVGNLVEDGACSPAFTGDPKLGPLADNGGPTQTFALLAGSPAIDAGNATACPATDQRGVARPLGAGCDIGAYEYPVPAARTDPATVLTARGATLHGTVNANYIETTVTFEYGPTTAYGTTVPVAGGSLTGLADSAVSHALSGLTPPNTTYHYRVVAENSAGRTFGADQAFTTPPDLPSATTDPATAVTVTGATLHGLVGAGNGSATVTFEYGLTGAYGQSVVATQSPVTGLSDTAVSYTLGGLTPGTTYHYRVVAQNSAGLAAGADRSFTTDLHRLYLPLVGR
ncbi:MAG: choice-of-anchor Q domain-containing protein [Chloroflexota bacterium]